MTWLTEVTELISRKKIIKGVKQENFLEEERPRLETKRGHFILSPRNVETSKPKQHHFKVWLTMRKKRRFWKFPERTTGSSAKEYYQIGNTALMSKTDDRRAKQESPCFTYTEPVKLSIKYEKKKKKTGSHMQGHWKFDASYSWEVTWGWKHENWRKYKSKIKWNELTLLLPMWVYDVFSLFITRLTWSPYLIEILIIPLSQGFSFPWH